MTMIKIEDLAGMEQGIRDLEDTLKALPLLIFECKLILFHAKKEAGITGPILPPVEPVPVEAVAA